MNFQSARHHLRNAIIQRDCARWLAQHGQTEGAAICRVRMRIAAKNMVTALTLADLSARAAAHDIGPTSFFLPHSAV